MTISSTPQPCADVAIIIVAFNSAHTLPRVSEALRQQSLAPKEVWVLENGSPNAPVTQDLCPDGAHLIVSETNLGFTGGNNLLASKSSAKWLILLNPDAFPEPDWLENMMALAARWPDCPIFGCTQKVADDGEGHLDGVGDVYHFTGLPYRAGYGKVLEPPQEGYVFGPCGAMTMVDRALFLGLGGFDEDLFCYCEDVDLAYRINLLGFRAIQTNHAAVHHMGYASSGRRSAFATYYGARNRFWVFFKNTPGWLLWVLGPIHIAVTLLLWVSAARFGQFTLFAKALSDALKGWPRVMAKRRHVQKTRKISPWDMAKRMNWNPLNLLTRGHDVRPIRGDRAEH